MKQFIIALDQLLNTLFRGWADETISARSYRNSANGKEKWRKAKRYIDAFFRLFGQKDHCYESFKMEQGRLHMPPAYRTQHNAEDRVTP